MVKNVLYKSKTWSFQELLIYLSATNIGNSLPAPLEILHGRNIIMEKATVVDYNAVTTIL